MSISEFIHILTVFSCCFTIPHKSYFFCQECSSGPMGDRLISFAETGSSTNEDFLKIWSPYSSKKSENVTNIISISINQRLLELGKGVLYLHRDKNSL